MMFKDFKHALWGHWKKVEVKPPNTNSSKQMMWTAHVLTTEGGKWRAFAENIFKWNSWKETTLDQTMITWSIVDPYLWCHLVLLGYIEFTCWMMLMILFFKYSFMKTLFTYLIRYPSYVFCFGFYVDVLFISSSNFLVIQQQEKLQ